MSRREVVVLYLAGLCLLGLLLWWWWLQPAVPLPAQVPVAPAAEAAATPAPPAAPPTAAPAAVAAPPPQAPVPPPLPEPLRTAPQLSGVLSELLQLAEGGDVAAMQELGMRLSRCSDNRLRHLREQIRAIENYPSDSTSVVAVHARTHRENLERDIADCEALPAAQRNSGFDWLERAAAAGSGPAQLLYAQNALQEFLALEQSDVVDQIDEALRRRELARRFLAEAMTHCVPGALRAQLATGPVLLDNNDARSYAISHAALVDAVLREARAQGGDAAFEQSQQQSFDYLLGNLGEVARAEARRQGEAMYQACAPR